MAIMKNTARSVGCLHYIWPLFLGMIIFCSVAMAVVADILSHGRCEVPICPATTEMRKDDTILEGPPGLES